RPTDVPSHGESDSPIFRHRRLWAAGLVLFVKQNRCRIARTAHKGMASRASFQSPLYELRKGISQVSTGCAVILSPSRPVSDPFGPGEKISHLTSRDG